MYEPSTSSRAFELLSPSLMVYSASSSRSVTGRVSVWVSPSTAMVHLSLEVTGEPSLNQVASTLGLLTLQVKVALRPSVTSCSLRGTMISSGSSVGGNNAKSRIATDPVKSSGLIQAGKINKWRWRGHEMNRVPKLV